MNRFVALDSWRGLCACFVALMHFDVYSHLHFITCFDNGYMLVDFFFVLSGFVISANYQTRLMNGFGVGKFMVLRFGRLYPLHLFMLVCFIGFELIQVAAHGHSALSPASPFASDEKSLAAIAANLALIQSFDIFNTLTWNRPSWSIGTEFYTYIIYALMLVWSRQCSSLVIALVMISAPIAIIALSSHGLNTNYDYGLIRCVYGFSAGIVAFKIYDMYIRAERRTPGALTATFAEIISVAMMLAFVIFAGQRNFSVLAPYVFLAVVAIFSIERGFLSYIMKCRPLVALGTLSYSIYMVHLFVECRLFDIGHMIEMWSDKRLIETWSGVQLLGYIGAEHERLLSTQVWYGDVLHVLMLPIVIAVSYMTYRFIEEPCRDWFRGVSTSLFGSKSGTNLPKITVDIPQGHSAEAVAR